MLAKNISLRQGNTTAVTLAAGIYDGRSVCGVARTPLDEFTAIAGTIPSRFFTMDVALRTNGECIIVELGDGQVSGLPDQADATEFYRRLSLRVPYG